MLVLFENSNTRIKYTRITPTPEGWEILAGNWKVYIDNRTKF
jgi:hypothetical protein